MATNYPEEIKIKRNRIYEDVEKVCWSWGLYPKGHLKLYDKLTDIILKAYLAQKKKEESDE